MDGEKLRVNFFIGFFVAMTGIFLISFSGSTVLQLNPIGDLLALMTAIVWAVYSILVKKISEFGYNTIQITRRIFFYGLIFMVPVFFIFRFSWGIERFLQPVNIFNILFLGLGASALCFLTWNLAVKLLGAVKTSVYIYLVPVITVVTSVIVLSEKITWMSSLGIALTLGGLFLSEKKTWLTRNRISESLIRNLSFEGRTYCTAECLSVGLFHNLTFLEQYAIFVQIMDSAWYYYGLSLLEAGKLSTTIQV